MSNARNAQGEELFEGTRGPDDDFFCLKYQVWYRLEDCVYRGRNRTFSGCVNCFQGFLNIRSHEKGVAAPLIQAPRAAAEPAAGRSGHLLPFAVPAGQPRRAHDDRTGAGGLDDGKDD
jgi:hypothetical protein